MPEVMQVTDVYHCEKPTITGNCCPDAWIRFGNSCYLFVGTKATWMEASQLCAARGAVLAALESAQENAFIRGYIQVFGELGADLTTWIGGNDMDVEGIWKWSPSGQTVEFTDWGPGEPEGTGPNSGDCLEIWSWPNHNYRWGDAPCHLQRSFLCEKQITDGSIVG